MERPATAFESLTYGIKSYKAEMLRTAHRLTQAKENYREMVGEGINSWHDFLAQPEIGMTVREANGLIRLLEWIRATEVPLDEVNLATARFAASKGIVDPELFEDMKVLSLKDFKDRHHEEKTNNAPQTYTVVAMKRSNETGTLSRVYGVEDLEERIKHRIDD